MPPVDSSLSTNGQETATPELLAEFTVLERAYRELNARDGSAESRAFWWKVVALAGLLISLGVGIWDHLDRRTNTQAFVQNVQVTEDGRVISLGIPEPVLRYTPEDSAWYGMLGQWVHKVRWRSGDSVLTEKEWAWAYLHTCGKATTLLREYEKIEQPLAPSTKRVYVTLAGWNKTESPLTYHIRWHELIVEGQQVKRKTYNGLFSVGRIHLDDLEQIYTNPYGLCTTGFSISEEPL